ncbi:MAG TPA: hypothetical protein VN577_23555 [Terriglobales bacterium]|nr:hypothetical protein [Terriglobales bacterium]
MVHILVRHDVQDYTRWRATFDDALMMRRNAGELNYRIFRNFENANEVMVLCDFDSLEHARKYIASESLKAAMKTAGVTGTPVVNYLHEALSIRRTAAD